MKRLKWLLIVPLLVWILSNIDFQGGEKNGCAFCNSHILATQKIYTGSEASILVTYKPAVPGHLLIIPNRHVERFNELTEPEIAEMGALIKKIHGSKDYLLLQKNGPLAGQTVPHVHIHYLPRREEIGTLSFIARLLFRPLFKPVSPQELEQLVAEGQQTVF